MNKFLIFIALGFSFFLTGEQSEVFAASGIRVEPAKFEIPLNPGDEKSYSVRITNNDTRTVLLSVVSAPLSPNDLGTLSVAPENSLVSPDIVTVTFPGARLDPGEFVNIPFTIRIPESQALGSYYRGIVVRVAQEGERSSGAIVVSEVPVLLFTKIGSGWRESGFLKRFTRLEPLSGERFAVTYENSGTVYENPYGILTVSSLFGKSVLEVEVDPWFVLPGSSRTRTVETVEELEAGVYQAKIALNRGYDNTVDTKTIWFAVIPTLWSVIFLLLATLTLGGVIFKRVRIKAQNQ